LDWAIQTEALSKRFPANQGWGSLLFRRELAPAAVDGVSISVMPGEIFGLVGPNGAGKTTLIKLLATLITPTSGSARVNGFDISEDSAIKASIGLVTSDERSFYWRLTGRQNLRFFASLYGLPHDTADSKVQGILERVGLAEVADRRFQTYSTGLRQLLSIARAMLNTPRLLFLDEPTKGLDPLAAGRFHRFIREELSNQEQLTVFLTTHILDEAAALCDRIAIMNRGRVLVCGRPNELIESMGLRTRYQVRVAGFRPHISTLLLEQVPGVDQTPLIHGETLLEFENGGRNGVLDKVLDILHTEKVAFREITRLPPRLETIFRELVEQDNQIPSTQGPPAQQPGARIERQHIHAASVTRQPLSQHIRRVLHVALAFIKRDLLSEASYRFSFFLQFFGIFFSVIVFYFISQLLGDTASPYLSQYGGDYFSFVLIGIAFANYVSVGMASFSARLRQAQTTGTLEAMLSTPTSLSVIIFSSSLWDFLLTTIRVLVYLSIGGLFLGVNLRTSNYPAVILILFLTIITFSSLGIFAASFIMVIKRGDPVTWVFNTISSLFGGVYFPISVLPGWLQWLSKLLPITYSLETMRLALLKGASISLLLPGLLPLGAFCAVLLPLSLLAFSMAVRRARVDGTLTHY